MPRLTKTQEIEALKLRLQQAESMRTHIDGHLRAANLRADAAEVAQAEIRAELRKVWLMNHRLTEALLDQLGTPPAERSLFPSPQPQPRRQ